MPSKRSKRRSDSIGTSRTTSKICSAKSVMLVHNRTLPFEETRAVSHPSSISFNTIQWKNGQCKPRITTESRAHASKPSRKHPWTIPVRTRQDRQYPTAIMSIHTYPRLPQLQPSRQIRSLSPMVYCKSHRRSMPRLKIQLGMVSILPSRI